MKVACNLIALACMIIGNSALAQSRLPTPPPVARIMLNDITAAGSAVASDDPRVPSQPPPLETPPSEPQSIPNGNLAAGQPFSDVGGGANGEWPDGGCSN